MVVAAMIGLGLGMTGGVMLGGQIFKGHADEEERKYHHFDIVADNDEQVPEPMVTGTVTPEYRDILKYAPKWTTWPDFEQVRWLNSTIEWLWPYLSRAICKMVTDIVRPILEDIVAQQPMLDEIVIQELDFGPMPLRLAGVKVYDTKEDEVILEAPIQWGSAAKIHVLARVRVGPASLYIPLKVEDLQIAATARVTIRPLVDTLPCLGAITISLTESPYVDLSLKVINDMDLMALPFLHDAVLMAVKKVTEQICVYPNQIPIPLMENSGLPKPPTGMLEVTVHKATNLKGKDLIGKGDPYVTISVVTMGTIKDTNGHDKEIEAGEGPQHSTTVKKSTKHPEYQEHFKILVPELVPTNVLVFRIFDWDRISSDELVCEHRIPLDKESRLADFLRSGEEHAMTLTMSGEKGSMEEKSGKDMGQLSVTMQYTGFFNAAVDDESDDPAKAMERLAKQRQVKSISDTSKGVLTVDIMRCVDLPMSGSSCDSYVEVRLLDPDSPEGADVRRTEIINNERSPRFRAKFDFVYISATSIITLTVYDKPGTMEMSNIAKLGMKDDVALGKVRIHVKDVVKTGRIKDAFPLQEADQGDMHMELMWTSVERDE